MKYINMNIEKSVCERRCQKCKLYLLTKCTYNSKIYTVDFRKKIFNFVQGARSLGICFFFINWLYAFVTKVKLFFTHNGHIRKTILLACTPFSTIFLFFGLFRNSSVCFEMDPEHRNEPKQTEKIMYLFRETNRKKTEIG
jgi:hypothetical protein